MAGEPFIGLRAASALRRQTDELCQQAGFRPTVIFEGDDLSNVRGFVAAGLGVAVVPAPRAGSPEAVPGPVTYLEILDEGAVREIFLTWSAERRLLPATDLFRRHVLSRAAAGAAGRLGLVTGPLRVTGPSQSGDDARQDVDAQVRGEPLGEGGTGEPPAPAARPAARRAGRR